MPAEPAADNAEIRHDPVPQHRAPAIAVQPDETRPVAAVNAVGLAPAKAKPGGEAKARVVRSAARAVAGASAAHAARQHDRNAPRGCLPAIIEIAEDVLEIRPQVAEPSFRGGRHEDHVAADGYGGDRLSRGRQNLAEQADRIGRSLGAVGDRARNRIAGRRGDDHRRTAGNDRVGVGDQHVERSRRQLHVVVEPQVEVERAAGGFRAVPGEPHAPVPEQRAVAPDDMGIGHRRPHRLAGPVARSVVDQEQVVRSEVRLAAQRFEAGKRERLAIVTGHQHRDLRRLPHRRSLRCAPLKSFPVVLVWAEPALQENTFLQALESRLSSG